MSECGHCKDCRWWGEDDSQQYRICDRFSMPGSMLEPTAGFVEAIAVTLSDFGCVHFEPKEAHDGRGAL